MLYLISGASRSGKTLLAKTLLKDKNLPYLSLDWLMMGFNDGIPQYGIHHLLMPDEIARKIWGFLQGMIDNMLFEGLDYVIEGEALLPELVSELMKKYPGKVRVVFIGFTEINVDEKLSLIKKHSEGENDWLTKESDKYIRDHIVTMQKHSKMIAAECGKFDLPYFDTSKDFLRTIEQAKGYLLQV